MAQLAILGLTKPIGPKRQGSTFSEACVLGLTPQMLLRGIALACETVPAF